MSRKSKVNPVLKVELVERYLKDEIGIREATRLAGLSDNGTKSFKQWIKIERNEGPTELLEQKQNKYYSKETKLQAVHDYLNGVGSLMDVTAKYGIRSRQRLQAWIKMYNTHGEIRDRGNFRSFLDFGTASHSRTFTARKSDLLKVSKST